MKVILSDKSECEIGKLKLRTVPKIARMIRQLIEAVPKFKDKLSEITKTEKDEMIIIGIEMFTEWVPSIIENAWNPFVEVLADITGLEIEAMETLELENDLSKILEVFFDQNDFAKVFNKLKNAISHGEEK